MNDYQGKREFVWNEFNNNVGTYWSSFHGAPPGKVSCENAILMRVNPELTRRSLYIYAFALVSAAAGTDTFFWLTIDVKVIFKGVVQMIIPFNQYWMPEKTGFGGKTRPINRPDVPMGGEHTAGPLRFQPQDPFIDTDPSHVQNSPEPAETILQPFPVNFPADTISADITDTSMASAYHRIMIASVAW